MAFASAQLTSKCNPTVNATCPDNPAISASFEANFKSGKDALKGWDVENWSVENYAPKFTSEGVELTVSNKKDVPVLRTQGYFLFGKVEVRMKAAPGAGIVSSVVLASADLDEVDWEWLGGNHDKVQTNYFGKGNATTFDRVTDVPVQNQEYHVYGLDWTKEKLDWIIDGKVVRTLKYEEALGGKNYPQTPCTLGFGPWAAGDSDNKGTSEWAGGKIDWSKGPFTQTIDWVKITNYSPGTAYKWKDQSGSWQSIEVIGAGNQDGAPVNTETAKPAETKAPAATEGIGSHPTATGGEGAPKPSNTGDGEQPADTQTEGGYGSQPTTSSSCSEGEKPTAPPHPDQPCDCQTETTTVTGYPPESEVPPPPPSTEAPPPPPPATSESTTCTTSSTAPPPPPETTEVSPPPPQTTSEVPPPPPETTAPPPPPETYDVPPPPETSAPPPPPETSAPPPPPETTEVSPPPPNTSESTTCTTSTTALPPPPSKPVTGGSTSCTSSTSITITLSSQPPPPATTEVSPPPPATTLQTSATSPPYPTIKTDTAVYPQPSAPTGGVAVPTGGNSSTPPIEQFPGAASHNTAGALFGLVGAVMLMAF